MKRTEVQALWVKQWIEMRSRPRPVPYSVIANLYGVDKAIVHRYCKGRVPPTRATSWRSADYDRARALDRLGVSRVEIARQLGVSAPRITQVLGPRAAA